jgi:hypothetical protein
MLAIDRLERSMRSRLPNPATELETTLTRDTELTFVPKSAWGENDEGNEEQTQSDHQQGGVEAKDGNLTAGTATQSANFASPQNQHTPAQMPHSKQAKTPESRLAFLGRRFRDPNLTEEERDAAYQEYRNTPIYAGPPKKPKRPY